MNPVRWRSTALIFLAISVVFLVGTITIPEVRWPQTAVYQGPAVPYFGSNTALSGYYIPTVEKGTQVNVTFSNFVPKKVEISVFPTRPGDIAPVPGTIPVYANTLLSNSTISFRALETQPYGVYVISYDNTTFLMKVRAVYSPFYWLASYSVAGAICAFASAILLYYYTFNSRRWTKEQKALREAAASGMAAQRFTRPPPFGRTFRVSP